METSWHTKVAHLRRAQIAPASLLLALSLATEATMRLIIDEKDGEQGASAHLYENQLRPMLPECETEECRDQPFQVDLAATAHAL